MQVTKKAFLPKFVKGVLTTHVGTFNGARLVQDTFNGALDIALVGSGMNRTDILKAGGRVKRISLAFVATHYYFYDKIHQSEQTLLASQATQTLLTNAPMTQFPLLYEGVFGRVPYSKQSGQLVSFSFSGISVLSDAFFIWISTDDAMNPPNPNISIEVSFQIEYPRVSKPGSMLKRRILSQQEVQPVKIVGSMKTPYKKQRFKRKLNRGTRRRKYGARKKA